MSDTLTNELLRLCLDMEGRLRVLDNRTGLAEALSALRDDYDRFNNLMTHYLGNTDTVNATKEAEAVTAETDDDEFFPGTADTETETAEPAGQPRNAAEPEIAVTPEMHTPERPARPNLLGAFTLNDKFRFRRYVFECSEDEFREIIDTLDGMTYPEAQDYIVNQLMLDPQDFDVKDLLGILHDNLPAE